jgi:hypothetical protein
MCCRTSRKIIEVFALESVRRPAARSFSEEGEIWFESLVRILTGLTGFGRVNASYDDNEVVFW